MMDKTDKLPEHAHLSANRDLRDGVAGPSARSEGGDEPYKS